MIVPLIFDSSTESRIEPIPIEIAVFSSIVEFVNSIKPFVSITNTPPNIAKLFLMRQLEHETNDRSFAQNTPPSEAELYSNTEPNI